MKEYLKKHIINLKGPKIRDKIVVFESDDWGSIRIPNKKVKEKLLEINAIQRNDPFSNYDCLESSYDLDALYRILSKYRDNYGRNPSVTLNIVMTNPDFEFIRNTQYSEYKGELFTETYKRYYPKLETYQKLTEGIKKKLVFPQFHALEHLNVRKWMNKLRLGDEQFLKAFDLECFAIDDNSHNNQRGNLMATYDYLSGEELDEIRKSISEGLILFHDVFGFDSKTTIAPCYVWNDQIEVVFNKHGIVGIQGSYIQQKNNFGVLYRKWRSMGNKNILGQRYFIRNGLFEPSLNQNLSWVEKTLESMQIAFKWNKPAIIGTHRINYVGGLSEYNRENALTQLDELIYKVLKKWPDVQFLNSAELVERYNNG